MSARSLVEQCPPLPRPDEVLRPDVKYKFEIFQRNVSEYRNMSKIFTDLTPKVEIFKKVTSQTLIKITF